jgi:hypothetical protein
MNVRNGIRLAVAIFVLLACAGSVLAANATEVRQSFRSVAGIALSGEIPVPTIALLALPIEVAGSQIFGVYSISDDAFLPYEVRRSESRAVSVQVSSPDNMGVSALGSLVDGNHATTVDFPLPENGGAGQVTLKYVFEAPITSNSLQMALSQYVVRPTAVTIQAEIDGEVRTVVARTAPRDNSVSFPVFTSRVWSVMLEYAQPLRFTELSFINTNVVEESATLVFLAQPGSTYKLYYHPEVILSQETGERPQLSDTNGAVSLTLVQRGTNALYQPADSDQDSIEDLVDNCPRTANADQKDIDGNGRGDVCDDFDRDGVENGIDNCIDTPNRNQADIDRDKVGDTCDKEESRLTEKYPWIVWIGLGFASLVFVALFFVALRHKEEPKVVKTDSNSTGIQ